MLKSEELSLDRREFLAGAGAFAAGSFLSHPLKASLTGFASSPTSKLGDWLDDDYGLPCYRYSGPLKFPESPRENGSVMLPDDPLFLLGNYRLTLFTHASGVYQMLTGERAWGRMNQGDAPYSGANQATVEVANQRHSLIGVDESAAQAAVKHFGVGFARYEYSLAPSLQVTRLISVLPSTSLSDGASAFLVQVRLRNTGSGALRVNYNESTRARYQQIFSP